MDELDKLNELDVIIRRKGSNVVAGIPQLRIYAKGKNLESALGALEVKKEQFISDLEAAGELGVLNSDDQPELTAQNSRRVGPGEVGRFAIKTTIVASIAAIAIVISGAFIVSQINGTIANTLDIVKNTKIGGSQFWTRVEHQLDEMASPKRDLSPAKKKKLLADIRMIGAKWRPFAVEIRSALTVPADAQVPASVSVTKEPGK